jgi:membrane fusion protein (multidrug efflux system)
MFDEDLTTAEEFDAIRTELKAAEASKELAAIELSHTRVKAPFGGRIVRRFVDPGQMVNNGVQLFTLADMNRLLARVHVPARVFREIQRNQPVELTLDSNQIRLQGTIILISSVIDPTSGTIKVTVAITDYPENTRSGDFAEVRIVTDQHPNALLVPRSSVIIDKGEEIVFVAHEGFAERRSVTTGFQNERHIEILKGLSDHEKVVVQGQHSLKDKQPLKILDPIEFKPSREKQGNP